MTDHAGGPSGVGGRPLLPSPQVVRKPNKCLGCQLQFQKGRGQGVGETSAERWTTGWSFGAQTSGDLVSRQVSSLSVHSFNKHLGASGDFSQALLGLLGLYFQQGAGHSAC